MLKMKVFVPLVLSGLLLVGCGGGGNNKPTENNTQVNNTQANNATVSEADNTSENTTTEEDVPTEYKSALRSAENYGTMNMSKQAIYDQLTSEFDQFPAEAAEYAIENVDVDWNENALKSAKVYQEDMAMSKAAIYDQLISEYGDKFTEEQAQYAVDNLPD